MGNVSDKEFKPLPDISFDEFTPADYSEWRSLAEEQLGGASFEKKLVTKTTDGISIDPIYFPEDGERASSLFTEYPGHSVRSFKPSGHVNGWKIAQAISHSTPELANTFIKSECLRGLNAVRIICDISIRNGQFKEEDIGRNGVAIHSLNHLKALFDGIDLKNLKIIVEAGAGTKAIVPLFFEYFTSSESALSELDICFVFDPFTIVQDQALFPNSKSPQVQSLLEDQLSLLKWLNKNEIPSWKVLGIDSRLYAEAGGSYSSELGFSLAHMIEMLRFLHSRGVSSDLISTSLHFHVSTGPRLFPEVAKLRAQRHIILKALEPLEISPPEILAMSNVRFRTKTDPYVNMLRATTESFAAVLAGVDSLTILEFDSLFGSGDEFSRRIARNTQLIISDETNLHRVIDPAAGSYYIDSLTRDIAQASWQLFQTIETEGGIANEIKKGVIKERIQVEQTAELTKVAQRRTTVVGTNNFVDISEEVPSYPRVNLKSLQKECVGIPSENAGQTLDDCIVAIQGGSCIAELFNNNTPTEEIQTLQRIRLSEAYEALRSHAERHSETKGKRPLVTLIPLGAVGQYKPRCDFSRDFFLPGGFEVEENMGFKDSAHALSHIKKKMPDVAVICSADTVYPDIVPSLAKALKSQYPNLIVVLAGFPKEHIEEFKSAGVDEFIHLRANNLEMLTSFQKQLGVQ